MTDQATRAESAVEGEPTPAAELKWVTVEQPPRRKHWGLWLGIPGGAVVAAAVVAALVLIAPGVSVAGASVGMTTPGLAQQAISDRLAKTQIHIGGATLTAAQLGASIDAKKLAADAKSSHPLWNITAWHPQPTEGAVTIDPAVALPALRKAAPELFSSATEAGVVFDKASGKFTTTPAKPGRGVDVAALATSLSAALASPEATAGTALAAGAGESAASGVAVTLAPKETEVDAAATTAKAEAFADKLNQQASAAGFYLQGTRAASIPLATVASWITVTADATTGDFTVTPNESAIAKAAASVPAEVNTKAQNEEVVTNSAGKSLRVITQGHDGFGVTSSDAIATQISDALKSGDLKVSLAGEVQKYKTTTIFRRIEVDKSEGATYLYQGSTPADAKRIASFPIALGTGGVHETRDGHYTIYAQLASQDMGDCDGHDYGYGYCTPHVPWVSYFDKDQGFHGTYWHNDFGPGARKSHGCVNMRIADALTLYKFAQIGTEVWVHE